ncbi:hypothetical protein BCD67_18470 [Oscillatoriales cyanobacterium USR001]|nr:hypothetical protein BCD67_18470 [Oscillatoriales cyanobacterium USR001]
MAKKLLPFFIILIIAFIAIGDSLTFFPKPVKEASVKSRTFVIGLWPKWLRPRNTNEGREKDIENLDKQK